VSTQKQSFIERLISLLQGASLALAILGAIYAFSLMNPLGFFLALVSGFLGMLPGLSFVVLFEVANIQFEKLREIQKQNTLLEEVLEKLSCDD
jgi:hypothetical protein